MTVNNIENIVFRKGDLLIYNGTDWIQIDTSEISNDILKKYHISEEELYQMIKEKYPERIVY